MQMFYSRDTISISELFWTSLQRRGKVQSFSLTISFFCIGMKTKPRFHNEAQNNSEMAYCIAPAWLFFCAERARTYTTLRFGLRLNIMKE